MKTFSHRPLRSNFINPDSITKKTKTRGVSRPVSKLDQITKESRYSPYDGAARQKTNIRIANIRRLGNKTNFRYKVVGIADPLTGDFDQVKQELRNQKFTGIRMGGLSFKL